MDTKFCSKCGVEKPATVEWFSRAKTGRYGLKAECKECDNKRSKEYYTKNKNKIKKRINEYLENNKEELKNKRKKKYKDNRENMLEATKLYYQNNIERMRMLNKISQGKRKEKIKEYQKAYFKNNKELSNIRTQNYRAIKKQLPNNLTLKQWQSTKDYFNHECAYCGKQLKNLAQEHVIPLSKGGGYTKGNIIPSCKSCNSSKSASNMKTWYTTQTYFSIERYNKILAFIKEHKSIHDYTPIKEKSHEALLHSKRNG